MLSMRKTVAAVLLCATCSNAIAADAPLPAGKAAGTKQAALAGPGFVILLGLAGVAAMTALMVSSQDHNNGVTTPTTTGTTGTGV
jgi:hypothetical protein